MTVNTSSVFNHQTSEVVAVLTLYILLLFQFNEFMANISKVPVDKVKTELNNVAVGALYKTLTHPPATFLDKKFRSADGSGNSLLYPDLGKSGLPYARSVQTQHPLPASSLPDPGLIFDVLLKAKEGNVR